MNGYTCHSLTIRKYMCVHSDILMGKGYVNRSRCPQKQKVDVKPGPAPWSADLCLPRARLLGVLPGLL